MNVKLNIDIPWLFQGFGPDIPHPPVLGSIQAGRRSEGHIRREMG
jgi:hypothetical protein